MQIEEVEERIQATLHQGLEGRENQAGLQTYYQATVDLCNFRNKRGFPTYLFNSMILERERIVKGMCQKFAVCLDKWGICQRTHHTDTPLPKIRLF